MFGFSYWLSNSIITKELQLPNVTSTFVGQNYRAYNQMISKFISDKVFFENDQYLIIIDGIILNKGDLLNTTHRSWTDTVISLYVNSGESFFRQFKGSFSGVFYDKSRKKSILFSDQIGTKFMYYTQTSKGLFFSSCIANVYSYLSQNNIPYSLSIENAYLLLSYGYMLENRTLSDSIFKLRPGTYLVYEDNKLVEKQYFLLDNTPDDSITEKDAIILMDECFRKAIQLQFDKDIEYGFKHFVALSAGLDSRMVTWVAHEMGYTNQLNFTFSQINYWDQTVPQQIITDLKHEWIFKALDNGLWLFDVDDITKVTGGNVLYFGQAHSHSLMKYLNFDGLGLIHSGQQGDIAFDNYYSSNDPNKQYVLGEGAFSTKYLNRIENIKLQKFKNEEIANYYYRSFSGANHGLVSYNNYTEVKSPFADIDVLQTILKVPLEIRTNRNLYFKWMQQKYPKSADYVWDHIGMPINRKKFIIKFHSRRIPMERIPQIIAQRMGLKKTNPNNNMNPLGYYLSTNPDLVNFYNKYFDDNLDLVIDNELREDIIDIKNSNNAIEKIQAISLLSALKLFFNK